jgi:cytochrome P450
MGDRAGVSADGGAPQTHRGCPVVHTDYRIERELLGHYGLLNAEREMAPVLWNDSTRHPFWMVTRFQDVHEALQQPEIFSNEVINALNPRMAVRFLPQNLDPPEHTAMRRVLNRWFSPKAVRRLEPFIARRCAELLDELAPAGECDFVTEFGIKLPTDIFLVALGLPLEDSAQCVSWVETMFSSYSGGRAAIGAAEALKQYFADSMAERRRQPRDPAVDFLSYLLTTGPDGEPFDDEAILTICMTLITAGLDTTRSALGYIFYHLATYPEHRQLIVADPGRIPRAIEELLRLYPLILQDGRLVTRDIDFHGCPMRAGDVVWLGIASANLDPRKFPDPERFDLDRPDLTQHLSFAVGPHRCLGMHLARHELAVVLREWHARIPDYWIEPGHELRERGAQLTLLSLPLRWQPS